MAGTSNGFRRHNAGKKSPGRSSRPDQILVQVTSSSPQEDPIVCSFPGGMPATLTENIQQQAENGNSQSFLDDSTRFVRIERDDVHSRQDNGNNRTTTSLIGKNNVCRYHADLTEGTRGRSRLLVGLYDKVTKKLTLQSAAGMGSVYALQQTVPVYNSSIEGNGFDAEDLSNKRRSLFLDFGSVKKQRALRSQEANRVDVQQVVGSAGMATIFDQGKNMSESNRRAVEEQQHLEDQHNQNGDVQTDTPAASSAALEAATQEWRKSFLPRFDVEATDPYRIYSALAMAGTDEAWGHICRMVDACYQKDDIVDALVNPNTKNEDAEAHSEYAHQHNDWAHNSIRSLLDEIASSSSRPKHRIRCAVLLNYYCNLYIKWQKKRFIAPIPEGRSRHFGVPRPIVDSFLNLFATQVTGSRQEGFGYCMSKANKDKCLVHMLLLFVLADSSSKNSVESRNFKNLAGDLKLDIAEASHLLRQAGCTVQHDSRTAVAVAILKAPVKFPAIGRRRGRA